MVNEPKVTIVTVTYQLIVSGREDYFRECVESVRNQTYKNIEHIVIDGASNDGTVKLIDEYAQKGWLTYISEPDSGIYDAMNKGIARASGKYVAFLNSDDFYHNHRAVDLSVQALETTGAGFSHAPMIVRQNHSQRSRCPNLYRCWSHMWVYHPTIFCQRELLERYSGFDASFRIAADYHWLLKVLTAGTPFVEIAESITTFRMNGISFTCENDTNREAIFAIYYVIRSHFAISLDDAYRIYATGYVPWRILCVLVAAYPKQIRYQFYRNNIWYQFKAIRKNLINIRLTRGKRDIRLLGWTLVSDRHIVTTSLENTMANPIIHLTTAWIPFRKVRRAARGCLLEVVSRAHSLVAATPRLSSGVIFDLGMNNGDDTDFYLKKGFKVVSVEANPALVRQAEQRFEKAIREGRLNIYSAGITDDASVTTADFYISPHHEWSSFDKSIAWRPVPDEWLSSARPHSAQQPEVIQVPLITLDTLIASHGMPYYLKIDIEAYDTRVLASLRGHTTKPKYASVENVTRTNVDLCYELGARKFKIVDQANNPQVVLPFPPREGVFANHTFRLGATGAFGNDIAGDWMPYDMVCAYIASHAEVQNTWYDLHAMWE